MMSSASEAMQTSNHWRPQHRSVIAALIWKTFAAGSLCSWNRGQIRYPAEDDYDLPHFPEFPSAYVKTDTPDWMVDLLAALDAALPPVDAMLDAMDIDSMTFGAWPAAFRMPSFPSPDDAGHCLLASRVLLACKDEFVGPIFVDDEVACGWIEQSSWLALMMGGEQAFLTALALAADPHTFTPNETPPDEGEIAIVE